MFEAFAIELIKVSRSVEEAGKLLGVNWHQVETIQKRAGKRGLSRRRAEEIAWIGIDEKGFLKGHKYVFLLNDLERWRVLEVVEDRDKRASKNLLDNLNEAVDKIRIQAHHTLQGQNDDRLTGTKYLWLKGFEHLSQEAQESFAALRNAGLQVAKVWELKELFVHFWSRRDARWAQLFFTNWFEQAVHSGLTPIRKVAQMIKKHLSNLLTYFSR
ncbi:MAG: hypothetical protein GKR87_03120 [Kiritimatiellae bacterium]|nr:hypothetical protein [Kiritimatiellia bacterium]